MNLTDNVVRVLEWLPDDAKLIPGHGPLSTKDDLRAYHNALVRTIEIVRGRIAAGKTLEQIKKEGLPEEWAEWGSGFIKTDAWLETVYNSLPKDK